MSETDNIARGNHVVPTEWAKQLERERDEARELHRNALRAREATEREVDAMLERAHKAELERDEAREKVEQQRKEIVRLNGSTSHAGGTPLKIALRERDEAREALEFRRELYKVQEKCLEDARRERDEARAVADELASIATRYLAWHLSRTPMGPDDDHLAQSRKITEAIARWKSLASA